jgi:hypothetical protein
MANILMPALSPTTSVVMARLDRAIHPARVGALMEFCAHLGGPHSRAMTSGGYA